MNHFKCCLVLGCCLGLPSACGQASETKSDDATAGTSNATGGATSLSSGGATSSSSGGSSSVTGGASQGVAGAGGVAECQGKYESLPVTTPPLELPTTALETELCNARDSRTWAIRVRANSPVSIELENPEVIDRFDLGVYRNDVGGYVPLPVTAGATQGELGDLAERDLSFTPTEAGVVGLYASLGRSRGQIRLSITQP